MSAVVRGMRLAALAAGLLSLLAASASAVVEVGGPPRGIAVIPFVTPGHAGSNDAMQAWPDVAGMLAGELATRSGERVVSPEAVLHDERGLDDPQARDVRRWALWNSVENVVVGRLGRSQRHLDVEIELLSGHSGAPRAAYRLAPEADGDLDGAVTRLASLILADLGENADTATDALPSVSAAGPGRVADDSGSAADGDEGDGISLLPGVARDDPISINSEELEVLPQDGGRRLVFSRNVEVQQGNITLKADRLEAVYPQGASQPDLLVASGHVRVVQGERRGRCEEATYERATHTIVCRGQAEVVQGCDQVRGEEIEFDLANERVRVSGAASVLIQPDADDDDSDCAREGSSAASASAPADDGDGR